MVTSVRNIFFNKGWFRSQCYSLPIISVGNIVVGGTGKTPHTEYLIRLIRPIYRLCTLSRGYGRKTKGFRWVSPKDVACNVGDEPLQMSQKFTDVRVAVCEKRREGIERICQESNPEVILLDDAYQHRWVTPSLNILLTDYHRLYTNDNLLPMGRLRERKSGAKRADVVIVTKCPTDITIEESKNIGKELKLSSEQYLFFSTIVYGVPYRLFNIFSSENEQKTSTSFVIEKYSTILALTAIAHNESFLQHIERKGIKIESLSYPDHHAFTPTDVVQINQCFSKIKSMNKCIVTTEKDAARLRTLEGLSSEVKAALWVLPITIEILFNKQSELNKLIIHHINSFWRR